MIFRNRPCLVIQKRKSFLDILLNHLVVMGKSSTAVFRIQRGLRLVHIGNAQILGRILRMIRKTVNHCQTKVGIGAAEESLSFVRKHLFRSTLLCDCLESCICSGDHIVICLPGVYVAFIVSLLDRLPVIILVNESGGILVSFAIEFAVV